MWGTSTLELKQKRTETQERVDKRLEVERISRRPVPSASRTAPPGSVPSHPALSASPARHRPPWPDIGLPVPAAPVGAIPSPAMPSDLSGTWNLLSSDNVEGYMRALGRRKGQCGGASDSGRASGSGRRRPGWPAGPSSCVPSPASVRPWSLTTGSPGPPLPHPHLSSVPRNVCLTVVGLPPPTVC